MLIANLIFVYHVIVASEHLLETAAARSDGNLREYFSRHLEEERGHAEWLAEDLHSVGVDVKRTKLPREAVEMAGSVYYMVFHADPVALLGYMAVLENCPFPESEIAAAEKLYGKALLRTVRYHARHDPSHLAELTAVIEGLPASRRSLVEQTQSLTREYLQRASAAMAAYEYGATA